MSKLVPALLIVFFGAYTSIADEAVVYEGLIQANKLPAGYEMLKREVKDGEKVAATYLIVASDQSKSNVVIAVENRDLPTDRHRIAAVKGYINGTAKSLVNAGFKIVQQEVPDVENADLSKPVVTKLTLKKDEDQTLFVDIRSLVAGIGCNVTTTALSTQDRVVLTNWANTVLPLGK